MTEGEIKYASVSGSHANQVMRLWHYRQKHADPKMTTQQVLSLEILATRDPQYFNAIERAEWLVFSKEVSSIPAFFSSARTRPGNWRDQKLNYNSALGL